jgi:tetratricopeptide (TPR) repeat protein
MRLRLLAVLIGTVNAWCVAQTDKIKEYQLEQEQFRKTQLLREIDSGKHYMELGEYALADIKFKYVLDIIKSVPSELTYLFGKNSFYLGKFKQSVDWLNKYIQLKGTTGQYYEEAVTVLQKAESELINQRKTEPSQIADVLSRNYDIDCGPGGKVICPVCRGATVIVKPGVFGNSYKTCPYCDKHGLLTCGEYNRLVRGELAEKQ